MLKYELPEGVTLLNCPFDNEEVLLACTETEVHDEYSIHCQHCGIVMADEDKDELIKSWNTRHVG